MTPRDREIYHYVEMVGLCTAQQIKDVFMPTVDITKAYQRLRELVRQEYIKVFKVGLNNYYYVGRKTSNKMIEHDLKTTELVGYLISNGAEILSFKRNRIIGRNLKDNIYTDAYISYKVSIDDKKYKRHILVEVQRTVQYKPNPSLGKLHGCVDKYNHSSVLEGLNILTVESGFKYPPSLVVVTNIEDSVTKLISTKMIKLPYSKSEKWEVLIR